MNFFNTLTGKAQEEERRHEAESKARAAERQKKLEEGRRMQAEQDAYAARLEKEEQNKRCSEAEYRAKTALLEKEEERIRREKAEQESNAALHEKETERLKREEALRETNAALREKEEERLRREEAEKEANAAMKAKEMERQRREESEIEADAALREKKQERQMREEAEKARQAALHEKEIERLKREEAEVEKAVLLEKEQTAREMQSQYQQDLEEERKDKERQTAHRRLAEQMTEDVKSELQETADKLSYVDQERQKLESEKQERERRRQEQMSFKWSDETYLQWTKEGEEELRQSILQPKMNSRNERITLKLLVFGPTGSGKSSLCNGFRSALLAEKAVSHYYPVGAGARSFTRSFNGAKYEDTWIIDMPGIFEAKTISDEAVRNIASGKVPFYSQIAENLEDKSNVPRPANNDLACIVVVMKAGIDLGNEVKRQLDVIRDLMGRGVISAHLVMTFLDTCDPEFTDPTHLLNVFKNGNVKEAVKEISLMTGFAPNAISVVKNYYGEKVTDMYTNILLLHALDCAMRNAMEQVEKKINMQMLQAGEEPEGMLSRSLKFLHLA